MTDPIEKTKDVAAAATHPVETTKGLAAEADHGRSARTPAIALTGVTLVVGAIVAVLMIVVVVVYVLA